MEPAPVLGHGEVTGRVRDTPTHGPEQPVAGDAGMNGAAAPLLLLLLLGGRAAFTVCRSLNTPQDGAVLRQDGETDGTDGLTVTGKGVYASNTTVRSAGRYVILLISPV